MGFTTREEDGRVVAVVGPAFVLNFGAARRQVEAVHGRRGAWERRAYCGWAERMESRL
jgi:hypothetical protein